VNRRTLSNLGIYVYGAGAIALGVAGLVWSDFATDWQRVHENVPHRETLAYIAAIYELLAGIAILWPRSRKTGAAMLAFLYSVFTLLWARQILSSPRVYDGWGNFFEEFSLVVAGMVVYASLAPRNSVWAGKTAQIRRLYGICAISFGLEHLIYLAGAASYVPKWIPPGQMFWALATAIFFLLAAVAILSGILAGLASRLLTAMIVGFELLVWAPKFFTSPHDHFLWSANAISLALTGAAWAVSDSIVNSEKQTQP
jgi:uncharacterized membrane protein YphA (DoxX/SURF4 family)